MFATKCDIEYKPLAEDSRYFVDTQGNVYSSALWGRLNCSGKRKPHAGQYRKLKAVPNKDNLLVVGIGTKTRFVHDLVLSTFHGEKPAGSEVEFIDENPANVRLNNLRYTNAAIRKLEKIGYTLEHVRKVPGFDDYWASIHGEAISTKYKEARILKTLPNPFGYLRVSLRGKLYYLHRVVALAWLGEPPNADSQVRHFPSRNKADCRPCNLRYGDHWENQMDKVLQGSCKLSPDEITQIRALLVAGVSQTTLAKQFKISRSMIGHIATGTCWPSIGMTPEFLKWLDDWKTDSKYL